MVLRKENERNLKVKMPKFEKNVRFKEVPKVVPKGKPKNFDESKKAILMRLRAQRVEA